MTIIHIHCRITNTNFLFKSRPVSIRPTTADSQSPIKSATIFHNFQPWINTISIIIIIIIIIIIHTIHLFKLNYIFAIEIYRSFHTDVVIIVIIVLTEILE